MWTLVHIPSQSFTLSTIPQHTHTHIGTLMWRAILAVPTSALLSSLSSQTTVADFFSVFDIILEKL